MEFSITETGLWALGIGMILIADQVWSKLNGRHKEKEMRPYPDVESGIIERATSFSILPRLQVPVIRKCAELLNGTRLIRRHRITSHTPLCLIPDTCYTSAR